MSQNNQSLAATFVACLLILFTQATLAEEEFPGRKLNPEVPVIELKDLFANRGNVTIVDVRSTYEFDTLRIKGAINIAISEKDFVAQMQKLNSESDKPIVVYCNGKTCMKSYHAVHKAMIEGITNIKAYDAGVMDWAKTYPKETLLLGKPLEDPKKLISKEDFKKHTLSPDDFSERVASTNDIVLDVRDRFQREGLSIFVGREHRVDLDDIKQLDRYIEKAKRDGSGLLIYDAAGKQVVWFQYYLEEKGVKTYYFMDDGIDAYYKSMKQGN